MTDTQDSVADAEKAQDVAITAAHPALTSALETKGYKTLTPVQQACVDETLEGKDLLVSAQTGSGKTVAFGLAMASTLLGEAPRFDRVEAPLALIIAPTRELALQVKKELAWLYKDAGAKMASCVGGMDMRDERRALAAGAHIVVGTPGRLCDHIKRRSLKMDGIACLALDEADEMLKMGFREEIELILGAAPEQRRTLMFSATVPKTIVTLAKKYQNNAVRVNTKSAASQHVDIEYRALKVARGDEENAIANVLRFYDAKNAIVFGDTRIAVNRLVQRLNNRGFSVVALSGELNQKQRSDALQAMRDGRARVCVATDVAARGLDLPDLELVIHAAIPKNAEALLHRSGRTGRAGRKGVSALIVPSNGYRRANNILGAAKITAKWDNPPSAQEVQAKDDERMLSKFTLETPVTPEEELLIQRVLSEQTPGQIAAAFIRQYRSGQSAPEELGKAPEMLSRASYDSERRGRRDRKSGERGPREKRERKPREDFAGGVWYSLNLGRKQKADPKWILPMLFKSGDLRKGEIGAIKIEERTTFIEIAPSGNERFQDAIGPNGKLEKAITASHLGETPDFSAAGNPPPPKRKEPRSEQRAEDGFKRKPKSKDKFKGKGKNKSEYSDKPSAKTESYDPNAYPRKEQDYSDAPKKPHKKKLARAKALEDAKAKGKHGSTKSGPKKSGAKGKSKNRAGSGGEGKLMRRKKRS